MSKKKIQDYADVKQKIRLLDKAHSGKLGRYAKPFLEEMHIEGFRGLKSVSVQFPFPIVAISGANGSGKTTLMHLAGCAFANSGVSSFSPYMRTYFPVSVADPHPFGENCKVEYKFIAGDQGVEGRSRRLTISRRSGAKWEGYKRRVKRHVVYLGMSYFLPKFEKSDLSIYSAANVDLQDESPLDDRITRQIGRILKTNYDSAFEYTVGTLQKSVTLVGLERRGARYSENNMGLGEARVAYLVKEVEQAPKGTLFLLEEPEISLHADAQRRLMHYLVEACFDNDHQVLLTTHSRDIMAELPPKSLVYLQRNLEGDTEVLPSVSAYEAGGLLGSGPGGKRIVIVEDSVAETIVRESLRKANRHPFIKTISLVQGGDRSSILRLAESLRKIDNTEVAVVLDGDMRPKQNGAAEVPDSASEGTAVLYLPGSEAPEKEIVADTAVVQGLNEMYAVDIADVAASASDHHNYFREFAISASTTEEQCLSRAVEFYLKSKSEESALLAASLVEAFS